MTLFDGFFDDAALFPPGDAPMARAVQAHADLRRGLGDLVGPFVVPAARLDELAGVLRGGRIGVSLIARADALPGAVARLQDLDGAELAAVEVPPPADAEAARVVCAVVAAAVPAGIPVAVELPRTGHRDAVLDVLAGAGLRAKLRTGGLRADLFPSAAELAGTLAALLHRGVAFKCTAGLHAPLPHVDPVTGFAHHGFLAVLAAVDALADGAPTDQAAARLAGTDAPALAAELTGWSSDRAARARGWFTSFGTCSVTEPVEHLRSLGLLPSPERMPA